MIITSRGVLNNGIRTGQWKDRITYASVIDGSSNTFMAGEMHVPDGQLNTIPYNGPLFNGKELVAHSRIGGTGVPLLAGSDSPGSIYGFGSSHPGTCNFVRTDGSTSPISLSIDTIVLANLCHRFDGEVIE